MEADDDHQRPALVREADPQVAFGVEDLRREHIDGVEGALAGGLTTVEVGGSEVIQEEVDIIIIPALCGALYAGLLGDVHTERVTLLSVSTQWPGLPLTGRRRGRPAPLRIGGRLNSYRAPCHRLDLAEREAPPPGATRSALAIRIRKATGANDWPAPRPGGPHQAGREHGVHRRGLRESWTESSQVTRPEASRCELLLFTIAQGRR